MSWDKILIGTLLAGGLLTISNCKKEEHLQAEMIQLFNLGFKMAKAGKDWQKVPLGLEKIKPVK